MHFLLLFWTHNASQCYSFNSFRYEMECDSSPTWRCCFFCESKNHFCVVTQRKLNYYPMILSGLPGVQFKYPLHFNLNSTWVCKKCKDSSSWEPNQGEVGRSFLNFGLVTKLSKGRQTIVDMTSVHYFIELIDDIERVMRSDWQLSPWQQQSSASN